MKIHRNDHYDALYQNCVNEFNLCKNLKWIFLNKQLFDLDEILTVASMDINI